MNDDSTASMFSLTVPITMTVAIAAAIVLPAVTNGQSASNRDSIRAEGIRDIGSRRELFVDHYLIDRMDNVRLKLHEPRPAPEMTQPADHLEYGTVIRDGDLFRLYTRDGRGAKFDGDITEVTRYCESRDGIHWTRPRLKLREVAGSSDNNIILHEPWVCHNFSPFLDARPGVPNEERYKALAGVHKGGGLVAFQSADGVNWKRIQQAPVVTSDDFAFDSQNVSFWSDVEQCYVCYFRTWQTPHGRLRTISRTTSRDFLTWTEPVALHPNQPGEHLYTSQTHPYFRAPHIYIALPTRFHPNRGESTDILLMTARGADRYERTFREAFIRPGLDPGRWGNRSNYAALNVVPTGPAEMSIYTTPFRRFTLRTDGFVSVHAGADTGALLTRPLRFDGSQLVINCSTSAAGSIIVEVQDMAGNALPGFAAADCKEFVGDEIIHVVQWTGGADINELAKAPVRLKFYMRETDLYSLNFGPGPQ